MCYTPMTGYRVKDLNQYLKDMDLNTIIIWTQCCQEQYQAVKLSVKGFEPLTIWTQTKYARNQLRHTRLRRIELRPSHLECDIHLSELEKLKLTKLVAKQKQKVYSDTCRYSVDIIRLWILFIAISHKLTPLKNNLSYKAPFTDTITCFEHIQLFT